MAQPSPEPAGAILWLWLVAAIGGNLFAAYWLVKALLLVQPRLRAQLTRHMQQLRSKCLGLSCRGRNSAGQQAGLEGHKGGDDKGPEAHGQQELIQGEEEDEDVVALVDAVLAKEPLPAMQRTMQSPDSHEQQPSMQGARHGGVSLGQEAAGVVVDVGQCAGAQRPGQSLTQVGSCGALIRHCHSDD